MKTSRILRILLLCVATSLMIGPARASTSVTVQNDSSWISESGNLWIFCEVTNTGDTWLQYVKVVATLKDASNAMVDVIYGFTEVQYVPPSATVPLAMVESDTAKSARVASYTLASEFMEASPIQQKLAISNLATSTNTLGDLEVLGQVQNQGDASSPYVKVTGSFYDTTGKLVYVGYTFTDPSEIPAGAIYSFKLTVYSPDRSSKIDHYNLIAESELAGYTSVPETPWPVLMLAAALTLAIVAFRKTEGSGDDDADA
jgi:hypothetical protein